MKYIERNKLGHTQLSTFINRHDVSLALAGFLKRRGIFFIAFQQCSTYKSQVEMK